MRMIAKAAGGLIALLECQGLSQSYSETAGASAQRNNGQSASYYWKSESVAGTAQLLTLFCRSCDPSQDGGRDVAHDIRSARHRRGDANSRQCGSKTCVQPRSKGVTFTRIAP